PVLRVAPQELPADRLSGEGLERLVGVRRAPVAFDHHSPPVGGAHAMRANALHSMQPEAFPAKIAAGYRAIHELSGFTSTFEVKCRSSGPANPGGSSRAPAQGGSRRCAGPAPARGPDRGLARCASPPPARPRPPGHR